MPSELKTLNKHPYIDITKLPSRACHLCTREVPFPRAFLLQVWDTPPSLDSVSHSVVSEVMWNTVM